MIKLFNRKLKFTNIRNQSFYIFLLHLTLSLFLMQHLTLIHTYTYEVFVQPVKYLACQILLMRVTCFANVLHEKIQISYVLHTYGKNNMLYFCRAKQVFDTVYVTDCMKSLIQDALTYTRCVHLYKMRTPIHDAHTFTRCAHLYTMHTPIHDAHTFTGR